MSTTPLEYYGTGKRKTSIARVHLRPGSGEYKLNDRDLDRFGCEEPICSRRQQLEVARGMLREFGNSGKCEDLLSECVATDRLAVDLDAFGDRGEMGTRVSTDAETLRFKEAGDHGGGRSLAVRTRDVNRPKRLKRRSRS